MENINYLSQLDIVIFEKCKLIDSLLIDKLDGDEENIAEVKNVIKKLILVKKSVKDILIAEARMISHEFIIKSYIDEKFDEYFLRD